MPCGTAGTTWRGFEKRWASKPLASWVAQQAEGDFNRDLHSHRPAIPIYGRAKFPFDNSFFRCLEQAIIWALDRGHTHHISFVIDGDLQNYDSFVVCFSCLLGIPWIRAAQAD